MERQTITGTLSTSGRMSGVLSVGGGTTDYNELENKPTYNGHVIEGELTNESLGIWQPKNYSTEEQNTGIKWIDGKDVYVKCYHNTLNNADNIFIDTVLNSTNIHILPMSSISIDTRGAYNTSFVFNCYDRCILRIICNISGIAVNCENYNSSNFGTSDVFIVLFYTKVGE